MKSPSAPVSSRTFVSTVLFPVTVLITIGMEMCIDLILESVIITEEILILISERVHCDDRIFFEYVFVYLVLFFGVHACDYVSDLCQYYFGSFLVLSKFLVRFLFFVSCQVFFFMAFKPLAFCHMFSSFFGG